MTHIWVRPLIAANKATKGKERRGRTTVPSFPLLSQEHTEEVSICQRLDIIFYIETHGAIMVPCHRQSLSLIKAFHPPLGLAVGPPVLCLVTCVISSSQSPHLDSELIETLSRSAPNEDRSSDGQASLIYITDVYQRVLSRLGMFHVT